MEKETYHPHVGTGGKRKRESMQRAWKYTVAKELQEFGVRSWAKALTVACDRYQWRELISWRKTAPNT